MPAKRISVKITPSAKKEGIIDEGNNCFKIKVGAPAVEGKANEAMIKILAEYFDIPKSRIKIVRGKFAKNKIIEIDKI